MIMASCMGQESQSCNSGLLDLPECLMHSIVERLHLKDRVSLSSTCKQCRPIWPFGTPSFLFAQIQDDGLWKLFDPSNRIVYFNRYPLLGYTTFIRYEKDGLLALTEYNYEWISDFFFNPFTEETSVSKRRTYSNGFPSIYIIHPDEDEHSSWIFRLNDHIMTIILDPIRTINRLWRQPHEKVLVLDGVYCNTHVFSARDRDFIMDVMGKLGIYDLVRGRRRVMAAPQEVELELEGFNSLIKTDGCYLVDFKGDLFSVFMRDNGDIKVYVYILAVPSMKWLRVGSSEHVFYVHHRRSKKMYSIFYSKELGKFTGKELDEATYFTQQIWIDPDWR